MISMGTQQPTFSNMEFSFNCWNCSSERPCTSASAPVPIIFAILYSSVPLAPIPMVRTAVKRKVVRAIAMTAITFRILLLRKLRFASFLMTALLLLPNRMSFIGLPPLLHDLTILDPNDAVGKLGDLTVMGNHHEGLMEFLACGFQKPQHIGAGLAVQIASRFISQDDCRL